MPAGWLQGVHRVVHDIVLLCLSQRVYHTFPMRINEKMFDSNSIMNYNKSVCKKEHNTLETDKERKKYDKKHDWFWPGRGRDQ